MGGLQKEGKVVVRMKEGTEDSRLERLTKQWSKIEHEVALGFQNAFTCFLLLWHIDSQVTLFSVLLPLCSLKDLYTAVPPTRKNIILETDVNILWELDEIKYRARVSPVYWFGALLENHFTVYSRCFHEDQGNDPCLRRPLFKLYDIENNFSTISS